MDIHEVKAFIDQKKVAVVDIRREDDFQEAHIEDAIHLDNTSMEQFLQTADKSQPVICYCYRGISSQSAAAYLKDQGFKEVYSMDGGFEAWRQTYPTT